FQTRSQAILPRARRKNPRTVEKRKNLREVFGKKQRPTRIRFLRRTSLCHRPSALWTHSCRNLEGRHPSLPNHARLLGASTLGLGLSRSADRKPGRKRIKLK